jgi:uncharacterized RDD family membrane protein YckC
MSNVILKRVAAFFVDYCVIAMYASALFIVMMLVVKVLHADLSQVSPWRGQVTGFLTLTLPVFLYFFLYEKGEQKSTPGKKVMQLQVVADGNSTSSAIFKRNVIKFLPWEIAHTGVHWIVFYNNHNQSPPTWVYVLLIMPQILVVIYFISIVVTGTKSFYDRIAGTSVRIGSKQKQ